MNKDEPKAALNYKENVRIKFNLFLNGPTMGNYYALMYAALSYATDSTITAARNKAQREVETDD